MRTETEIRDKIKEYENRLNEKYAVINYPLVNGYIDILNWVLKEGWM